MLKFHYHSQGRWLPILDLGTVRYFKWRCLTLSYNLEPAHTILEEENLS